MDHARVYFHLSTGVVLSDVIFFPSALSWRGAVSHPWPFAGLAGGQSGRAGALQTLLFCDAVPRPLNYYWSHGS